MEVVCIRRTDEASTGQPVSKNGRISPTAFWIGNLAISPYLCCVTCAHARPLHRLHHGFPQVSPPALDLICPRYDPTATACLTCGLLPAVVVAPGKFVRGGLSGSLMWEIKRKRQTVIAIPMTSVTHQIFGN
jgi:hypothetical protein